MMPDIRIEHFPEIIVAALRCVVPDHHAEAQLWPQFMTMLEQSDAQLTTDGLSGAIFFEPTDTGDVDLQLWIHVAKPFTATGRLSCQTVGGRQVVASTIRGDHAQVPAVQEQLNGFAAKNGLQVGPLTTIYRLSRAHNPDPNTWVTDVCLPIVTVSSRSATPSD